MRTQNRRLFPWPLLAVTILPLILSACGSSGKDATPTLSLEAIGTSAYQTFTANMATQIALTPPTSTPSPSPFPTFPPPSPLPTLSLLTTSTLASGGQTNCNDAVYVSDVTIPDKTVLNPGEKFVKTWLVQNNGTCPWTTSYKLAFHDGEKMGGADSFVPLQVPVGQQAQISVNLRAPTSSGFYYGRWQLQTDTGQSFGSILTVVIKVATVADMTASP